MKKRKMVVQIEIRNGKTIDDFVKFNNNFMPKHDVREINSTRTPEGVKSIFYYDEEAEEYLNGLREDGFKIIVN